MELSKISTIKDISKLLKVSWDTVRFIQEEYLKKEVKKIKLSDVKQIAIDELAIEKGHKYVTVVLNLETGAVLYIGNGKGSDALIDFWKKIKRAKAKIEAIAVDMSPAFTYAIKTNCPGAVIVYDHFHVIKKMNDSLSDLRRQVQNEANAQGKKTLKGTRWLLLSNIENLSGSKSTNLKTALKLNKPLSVGYYMKEELRQLWKMHNLEEASEALELWCKKARESKVIVLEKMAKLLVKHKEGILNYYKYRISTGPIEGFNNKAQTMKRQAYGYRNKEFYKLKLMTLHLKKYALTG